jgi:hypothetical protein
MFPFRLIIPITYQNMITFRLKGQSVKVLDYLLIVLTCLIHLYFCDILVPGKPEDFKATKVTSTSIELTWKAPHTNSDNGDNTSAGFRSSNRNIKGYEIHYFKVNPLTSSHESDFSSSLSFNPDGQVFKSKTNNIRRLRHRLVDLVPNSLYKIQIFAYNMKGDGERSNPILVNTHDDGPNKPENIRSEIHNDILYIRWEPPKTDIKLAQPVAGYRVYFNNEKYDVEGNVNQISLERPKWGKSSFL